MSERIGIAGGGAIASGLACVAAEHGQVVVWARRPDAATAKVEQLIERRGGVGAGNVSVTSDLDALRDATFVVEAIAEEQDIKAGLLRQLGSAATNGTILATTTSALSVTTLAEASGRPERFVGLHVFNPVPKMDLIELVFPPQADEETRERSRALCTALGKTAVEFRKGLKGLEDEVSESSAPRAALDPEPVKAPQRVTPSTPKPTFDDAPAAPSVPPKV